MFHLLLTKYNSNGQVKKDEMGRHVACIGKKGNAYRVLVGKPEENRPLTGHTNTCRWENNIEMDLKGILGWWFVLDSSG
jgi:hypothetical protein